MKRLIILALILILGITAVVVAELRKADAPVSARSILNFIADTQREIMRAPMRVTRLSDAEEVEIGDQLATHYARRWADGESAEESREVEAYLEKVGRKMAFRASRKLPYKFHYVPDRDFINAFALPGGHVFMGAGLLAQMETEDELASVLGHEIEHIDQYHCAERAQVEARARKIPLGGLMALPIVLFQAGYSKNQELESDREGTRLAVRASYSPYGAIHMFEKLEKLRQRHVERADSPQEELSRVALETLRDYFRSHPLSEERIQQIRAMIATNSWQNLTKEQPLAIRAFFRNEPARPKH